MSWGGPGGLTGEAAEREERALREYLEVGISRGVFETGTIDWDPQEGQFWVTINTATGYKHVWSPTEFRAYVQGITDMTDHARRAQAHVDQRMTVNPEPLKVVEAKAGESSEPEYIFSRRWRKERLVGASIHKDGCSLAPQDGLERADGTHWTADVISKREVNRSFAWAADQGVEAKVWCGKCGGWSKE